MLQGTIGLTRHDEIELEYLPGIVAVLSPRLHEFQAALASATDPDLKAALQAAVDSLSHSVTLAQAAYTQLRGNLFEP